MTTNRIRADELDLLVFELAAARHALPLECVREVARAVLITPLPDAPPVIEGIIDVRGDLVPVYDLRLRFGLPAQPLSPDDWLVTAWTGERVVAFRADRADEIVSAGRDAVAGREAVPGQSAYLAGVARLPDGIVLIDDLPAFLDAAERDSLAAALAAHAESGSTQDVPVR
ncbi:chemotaxis protein CheW [soil metagenome]